MARDRPTPRAVAVAWVLFGTLAPRAHCCKRRARGGGKSDSKALPDGWEEHEDDEGQVFYHNELKRETTWTRPRAPKPAPKPKRGEVTCTRPASSAAKPSLPSPPPPPDAPQLMYGWEEHTDDDGQRYYYHPGERRTTWTLPEGVTRV